MCAYGVVCMHTGILCAAVLGTAEPVPSYPAE